MTRVVVTGCGLVGAHGCGLEPLREALRTARPAVVEVDRSAGWHVEGAARLVASAARADTTRWVSAGEARRMSVPSCMALAAARMALAQAGLELAGAAPPAAVVLATSYGPMAHVEKLLQSILRESPAAASPSLFTESVANAPAAQIAIGCRALGTNVTLVQGETGALRAIARAAAEVASGRARAAIAGVVQEMTPLLHAVLDRSGALARADGDGVERARPFGRGRAGVLASEGAATWVLEAEDAALARGATPLARIAGSAAAFDPTAPRAGWGHGGEALASALREMLARSGAALPERIVSGAAGGRDADRLEAQVLRSAWSGESLPPVLAPKGVTGELGGGVIAACLLALGEVEIGAMAGVEEDEALGVLPHAGRLGPARSLLASSVAAGGGAAWLLLEGPS